MSAVVSHGPDKLAARARILDITPEQYHRDPCLTPSLSTSIGKIIVDQSELHAYAAHPRLGNTAHRDPTKSMERGTVGHRLLLGKGSDYVEISGFDNYSTKAAKELRDAARAEGKVPMLTRQLADAVEMALAAKNALRDQHGIILNGASEVCIEWTERVFMSDAEVICRCMVDHLFLDQGIIYDLKFVASAHPDACRKNMSTYGYDMQRASYTSALRALRPELAGREDFVFLFCEAEAPYAVTPIRPDGQFRELGQRRWDRAVRKWHQALTTGKWPGYTDSILSVAPATWALSREMENETYGE